ncbi:hypothetical protein [Pseudarcicella hirudinis]|nr:hypothetical protein [Pseudarcicella hirudinis]
MKEPIILFTEKDKKMISMNTFIADKRILSAKSEWNSNIQVIDSEGQQYFIQSLEQDSNLLLWESIKSVGLMVKVKPIFSQEPKPVTFEELKIRIKAHVSKNKRLWLPLDDGRGLDKMIDETNTFEELIRMFV